jgi:putative membrane protein
MIAWYGHPGMWGWGWWPGIAWTVLAGAALLAGAIYLARRRPAPPPTGPTPATGPGPATTRPAEEVLAERYARGDIDTGEYQDRLTVLREHQHSGPVP